MPELPDVVVYVERLSAFAGGRPLEAVRLASPFVLRTVEPPIEALLGRTVGSVRRIGKRIVLGFDGDHHLVIHLMIAGRLHWRPRKGPEARALAAFGFPGGTLLLTEAGSKKRASLHVVRGEEALAGFDRGGIDVLACPPEAFIAALRRESRTLKRALIDPAAFSGIGNAYSDEILHRARLSPAQLTGNLDDAEAARLAGAARAVLEEWIERLRVEVGEGFPERVTAFRREAPPRPAGSNPAGRTRATTARTGRWSAQGFAVHGRFGQPCPVCGTTVQRIVRGDHETNYCPRCQTGGRVLADRSLSRLLRDEWPRRLEELE